VTERLGAYSDLRNEPEREATSGLSPYLHFGHLSIHEVLLAIAAREDWSPSAIATKVDGRREGWWGMSPAAEAFLDQAVTWRELGFNFGAFQPRGDRFETLPEWARRTLMEHAGDPRPHRYDLGAFEAAATHDPLWNAAQVQLVREGRIHNYLRMLWGKKILEWTRGPEEALEIMLELNDRYALDGRDPSSTSGICWILGRYDRPWGPVRPIFGTVRYMSSENTARKFSVKGYLKAYLAT
jgi:deoxyribodipyrimidine photo-lyase